MKSTDLLRFIGDTDDKYIRSAEKFINKKEPTEFAKSAFSALKFAGAALTVVAVVLAIWIPSLFFPPDPQTTDPGADTGDTSEPAVTDAKESDTQEPVDTDGSGDALEYNFFVCGDQTVKGLRGLLFSEEYNEQHGGWICADGSGISHELITTDDPPTLYYRSGDKISFVSQPDIETGEMSLWSSDGYGVVAFERPSGYAPELYTYLEENPGEYYITVSYLKYGRTIDGQTEKARFTFGVKLVCVDASEIE